MSENTNTLFWVITGAVVILAIFLLINTSQSDTGNQIFEKYDSIYEEQDIMDPFKVYDTFTLPELGEEYLKVDACRSNSSYKNGYKVEVHDFSIDTNYNRSYIRYIVVNLSKQVIQKRLWVYFYKCSNNELITKGFYDIGVLQPGNKTILYSYGSNGLLTTNDFKYYVKLDIEDIT